MNIQFIQYFHHIFLLSEEAYTASGNMISPAMELLFRWVKAAWDGSHSLQPKSLKHSKPVINNRHGQTRERSDFLHERVAIIRLEISFTKLAMKM